MEPLAEKPQTVTAPAKKEEPDYSMNPEIKVLPHPEGPPVMRHDEHFSPAEEIEVKAQPPAPAPQPQAPKAQPNPKPASIAERAQQTSKSTSLNDKLAAKKLSFGLNDRIAYVKHLFDGQAEDFTRVVNQLNTYEAWDEAETFINEMVKPDYNWADKAEYEERFLSQIKARFEA